jgi:hypothetical protein
MSGLKILNFGKIKLDFFWTIKSIKTKFFKKLKYNLKKINTYKELAE